MIMIDPAPIKFKVVYGYDNCKEHPRYKGIRRPRTTCLQCWMLYLARRRHNCEEQQEVKQLAKLIINLMKDAKEWQYGTSLKFNKAKRKPGPHITHPSLSLNPGF